ncbi:MAG: iron-containing alcohol dehydrogenase [Planctomycetes bacterium]|nr:iron-containing alcohol dehydrogenase [Planctomycetota bacterium]
MDFEFATAARIIFGPGKAAEIPCAAASLGTKALLVCGRSAPGAPDLKTALRNHGVSVSLFVRSGEPTTDQAMLAAAAARDAAAEMVIGLGGGSSIDLAKAVSALITNPGDIRRYLEVVGDGEKLAAPPAPCIAVPTTAGTGAEVTLNAVLASPEHRVKVSLRAPGLVPRFAVIDPLLTLSAPPALTAAAGLDALTQLVESFVSPCASPLTGAVCLEGLQRASRSLRRVFSDGQDFPAREDMALAALFSGIALANSKLGAVHGIAGPFGGMFPGAPHGALCGRLLPHVAAANVQALCDRDPDGPALRRYDELGLLLTGNDAATSEEALEWISALVTDLAPPPLSAYGAAESDVPAIVEKALKSSSMNGNPVELTADEVAGIVLQAL